MGSDPRRLAPHGRGELRAGDDRRKRMGVGVSQSHKPAPNTPFGGESGRGPCHAQVGFPGRAGDNLDVSPRDAVAPPGSNGFECCFFGRKPRRIPL